MNPKFPGTMIRRERLRRGWSQEGLCRGICAVSYLSKIEQGKTSAANAILSALFDRLGLTWYGDEATVQWAGRLADECYEALFSGSSDALAAQMAVLERDHEKLLGGPLAPDFLLLSSFWQGKEAPIDPELEANLDHRQLALQRMLQKRLDEAAKLYPCAFLYYLAGEDAYCQGRSASALEYLQQGYDLAAAEGRASLMLDCKLLIGNCYSNTMEISAMETHYRIASRLAADLGRTDAMADIRYNIAATYLESGRYEEAYHLLSTLEDSSALSQHKLAICCEKLGKNEEALEAISRAERMPSEVPPPELASLMCQVVRFRLEHKDYLQSDTYGRLLLDCFSRCRTELPIGYASFHLPWVLEWYSAARQYRKAYELLKDFPVHNNLR